MAKILIINGPNLNLLGVREPDVYGRISMDDYLKALAVDYPHVEIDYYQSNHEGDLIDRLHEAGFDSSLAGIVFNAGAYTHTSLALADAIRRMLSDREAALRMAQTGRELVFRMFDTETNIAALQDLYCQQYTQWRATHGPNA